MVVPPPADAEAVEGWVYDALLLVVLARHVPEGLLSLRHGDQREGLPVVHCVLEPVQGPFLPLVGIVVPFSGLYAQSAPCT